MKSIQDTGLTCPQCDYNLTGLEEPHCPECGGQFTWQQVREHARQTPPTIAFEKARGWRKIPAFLETWLTMLFTPWVFARQAGQFICPGHAIVFCLLWSMVLHLLLLPETEPHSFSPPSFEGGLMVIFASFWTTMISMMFCCIPSLIFSLVDPAFYRSYSKTIGFWYNVCLYASGILMSLLAILALCYTLTSKLSKAYNIQFQGWGNSRGIIFSSVTLWMMTMLGCCLVMRWLQTKQK